MRSFQHRVFVIVLRILQVIVCNFCMGMLTCSYCSQHLQTGIPHILVLDPHSHAELDPEFAVTK